MSETTQLERMDAKLDRLVEEISIIKANQARDLERFLHIDRRFDAQLPTLAASITKHASDCPTARRVDLVERRQERGRAYLIGFASSLTILAAVVGWLCLRVIEHVFVGK